MNEPGSDKGSEAFERWWEGRCLHPMVKPACSAAWQAALSAASSNDMLDELERTLVPSSGLSYKAQVEKAYQLIRKARLCPPSSARGLVEGEPFELNGRRVQLTEVGIIPADPAPDATESHATTPDAYLVEYREIGTNGSKKRCVQASLEPREPTIMLPYDKDVESRELLNVTPLFAASATRRSDEEKSQERVR